MPGRRRASMDFAGAGRTDEQDVVSARSRDDHRPAGQRLAADVSEIGNLAPRIGRVEGDRHRRQDGLDAPQCIHDLTGRCGRVDLHLAAAGLSGFGRVLGRDIERPHTAGGSLQRHGQDAGHRAETAVQCQLPQKGCVLRRRLQLPGSGQHRHSRGRSYTGPVLRTSAGARLMVMRRSGHLKPRFFRAAWTRSPLSRTAESGRPTMERAGIPPEMSASTSTGKPLRPLRPKLLRTAYMGAPFCPMGRQRPSIKGDDKNFCGISKFRLR